MVGRLAGVACCNLIPIRIGETKLVAELSNLVLPVDRNLKTALLAG